MRAICLMLIPMMAIGLASCGKAAPTSTAPPASIPATRGSLVPRNDLAGLPNFAKVSDELYRGAQPTREGFLELKRLGVKTVVSFRAFHSDDELLAGTGIQLIEIPAMAWHPEDEDMLRFLKVVSDPANQPVFVHCQHGSDRTGCAVAVYRIVLQNWTPEAAAAELPAFGYHPIFAKIRSYLAQFNRKDTTIKLESIPMPNSKMP